MKKKTASIINVIVFTSLIAILSGVIYLNSKGNFTLLLSLSSLLIASMSVRLLIIYEYKEFSIIGMTMIIIDIVLAFFIGTFDSFGISKIIFLILVYDAVLAYSNLYGSITIVFSYFLYIGTDFVGHNSTSVKEFLPYLITDTAIFVFISVIIFAAKYGWKVKEKQFEQTTQTQNSIKDFSERENQIAQLILEGFSNKEIANKLFLAEGTVKNNISFIYEKIGVNDRAKAIIELKNIIKMDSNSSNVT